MHNAQPRPRIGMDTYIGISFMPHFNDQLIILDNHGHVALLITTEGKMVRCVKPC